jgi:hypothetical protein
MRTNRCIRQCAAAALALGLFGTAITASAQQTVVVAPEHETHDTHVSGGPNGYLFGSGLIMTGVAYTPALIVAINSDRSEDKYLYAPFVGPWLDLGARDGGSKGERTLLVVDGVFQAIGAIEILASFAFTGHTETAHAKDSTSVASRTIFVPAKLSEQGYGLVALGQF